MVVALETKIKDKINLIMKELKDNSPKIGRYTKIKHKILLKENKVVTSKAYKLPQKLVDPTKRENDRLLSENIITKSNSEFASPAFSIVKR